VETDKFYADTNNNMVDASSDDDDNDNEKEKEMNIGKRIRRDNADITESGKLYVLKRDGHAQEIHYDKIQSRLQSLSPDPTLDIARLTQKVITGVYPGVKTSELDTLAAETAAYLSLERQEYGTLASRISISNLHKSTSASFSKTLLSLANATSPTTGSQMRLISPSLLLLCAKYGPVIDAQVDAKRDYRHTYFGFKTLEKSYLLKSPSTAETLERPGYMLMRCALGIWGEGVSESLISTNKTAVGDRLKKAFETYELMSLGYFTHASPTLFHSGTAKPQLSSCFLLQMKADSIAGIYDTLKECALISKGAGGIGLSVSDIRARGSFIEGTKGYSNGLVPMLRVFDATSRYVDQGGGKRPGAFACFLEPWHADVFDFLDMKKNHGKEERRGRDLFYGLWVCDEFMRRVEADREWSLMCPCACPGLTTTHGEEFEELYRKYEEEGKYVKRIKARDLWKAILAAQVETGTPYMMYKDACNAKSNQKNLGTIKCSNLCTEIVEYTSPDEVAVCNLASVCLPRFVRGLKEEHGSPQAGEEPTYDYEALHSVVKVMTRNLNRVIDVNSYPLPEAEASNKRHRPIGLGVSGLADAFVRMGVSFDSEEARVINSRIFETIYHAALEASCELAEVEGTYESYEGSPASQGKLQFDLWEGEPHVPQMYDWSPLRALISKHGLRNSLLVAPMPTASTSQILGVNECIEPYTSNLYARRVKAGEFVVANPHLTADLGRRGLWDAKTRNRIVRDEGSVQGLAIGEDLKAMYKTVWEMSQRALIDLAADRGRYVCQSQSLNVFLAEPTFDKLSSMHFYGWKKGLKTGMYYLRSKGAASAIKFTLEEEGEGCLSCSG